MLMKVLLGLLLCISLVQAVTVQTVEYEMVYSPESGTEKGWDLNENEITRYPKYISVAQFLFVGDQDFYYENRAEVMTPPKITVEEGKDIISPVVYGEAKDGYLFESTYYEELPQLNIIFNCQMNGTALLSVSMDVTKKAEDESDKPETKTIKFYFAKECLYEGYRPGFQIGQYGVSPNGVVRHGNVQHKWTVDSYYDLEADVNVIGADVDPLGFSISLTFPSYGNQYYPAPEIHVEDDDLLTISTRGNTAQGGLATNIPEILYLSFECHDNGNTDVTVSISLGFYGTLRFGFTKICAPRPKDGNENLGQDASPGLINVGTSRSEYAAIVDQSVTSLFWDVVSSTVVVGHEEIFTNFYISTLSGRSQEVLKPIVTVNPPVFGVTLSGPFRDGGVASGAPQHLTVNYLCNRVSEAQIIITLKLPGFKTVEFSYLKKCKALKRHRGHVWTANQVMVLFVACIALIGICAFSYYRKKAPNATQKTNKSLRV